MEDPGILVQLGWPIGARSKCEFGWVRNIETKHKLTGAEATEANVQASDMLAYVWQVMQKQLPEVVIKDINNFANEHGIPPCDGAGENYQECHPNSSMRVKKEGLSTTPTSCITKYIIRLEDKSKNDSPAYTTYTFYNSGLAPPGANISRNYSRYFFYFVSFMHI